MREITPRCRQPFTKRCLSVIHLVDLGWRAQDAYIGQNIAQPNMHGFQPVERVFPVRRFLQIEVACFGNPLQILCQPLALQCGIACPLPQARGHSLGIDARGYDGNTNFALEGLVLSRSEDDIGVRIDLVADSVGRLVDFE